MIELLVLTFAQSGDCPSPTTWNGQLTLRHGHWTIWGGPNSPDRSQIYIRELDKNMAVCRRCHSTKVSSVEHKTEPVDEAHT